MSDSSDENIEDLNTRMLNIALGYMPAACLNVVVRLEIADLLSDGPKQIEELAKETGMQENSLYRILRSLSSIEIFSESEGKTFANTPLSQLLKKNDPNFHRETVLWLSDTFHFNNFKDLLPIVRDGQPGVMHNYNKQLFDYLDTDEKERKIYHRFQNKFAENAAQSVVSAYDFSQMNELFDIGGGYGALIIEIAKKFPHVSGGVYDLEKIIPETKDKIAKNDLADRLQAISGNFFENIPPAENYILKFIVHDWPYDKALLILRNCSKNLEKGGKILLVEFVIASDNMPHLSKWIDMEMLVTDGGLERTEDEFKELLSQSSMKLKKIIPIAMGLNIIEAEKV